MRVLSNSFKLKKHVFHVVFSLLFLISSVACELSHLEAGNYMNSYEAPSEVTDQPEVPEDNNQPKAPEDKVSNQSIDYEGAFEYFVEQGVPQLPLERALSFHYENKENQGGLMEDDCLLKTLHEQGRLPSRIQDNMTRSQVSEGIKNERYIMIVDFTKPNTSKRGYLLDLKAPTSSGYKLHRMTISHGRGSRQNQGIPQVFTNESGHGTTLRGFFVTGKKPYDFQSRSGYKSVGLRLYGIQNENNTAEKTSKVAHGAPYNSDNASGQSLGCPAMTQQNATKWLKSKLTGGALWYHHTIYEESNPVVSCN